MHEYSFSWMMDRALTKKLVKKQFYKYYFVQNLIKWLFFWESLFWILVFFDFNIYTLILSCSIVIYVLLALFAVYFMLLPSKPYFTQYHAQFDSDGFSVEGKTYKRRCQYSDVDQLIVRKNELIFVTRYEGLILPTSVFASAFERQGFIEEVKMLLK